MFDFLFALGLIELFSLSITVPTYEAKYVRLGHFHRGSTFLHSTFIDLFALNFYLDMVMSSPSTILGLRKLEALGYPVVKTASCCVSWF